MKLYQNLTQEIMEGKITKSEDILQEYIDRIRNTKKTLILINLKPIRLY